MQGQGFYDENNCLIYPEEIGVPDPSRGEAVVGRASRPVGTRSPVTRSYRTPLRRIGFSPAGVLGDIEKWWAGIPKNWRYGILGAVVAVGLVLAATGKKEKEGKEGFSWLVKK